MTARLLCTVLIVATLGCRKAESKKPEAQLQKRETPTAPVDVPAAPNQLARVRQRPAPCLSRHGAPPEELVERAAALLADGEPARALACSDEALRAAPRLVAALHRRAAALTALGRVDDARLAWARALAVDPEDPATLLGAAELHVSRMKGRDALLTGLEHALRGARVAEAQQEPDLAARLLLVAAMAENDLGHSREALRHADRALRERPADASLHYERGVALYELVRFAEARASLEKALELAPDDAWAVHYLSLCAEHEGELGRAEKLQARARQLLPGEFRSVEIGAAEFEAEVRRAIAALPDAERRALDAVPLELADVPALDDLTAVEPPLSPAILGLFRGPPAAERCDDGGDSCRSIVLYRRNLARFARDRRELAEQVRVTLLHEIGHLQGESDDELRDRGLE